ncbi:MAG: hypothetical protein AAGB34_11205, partial [Planctomycetota bacterium]
MRHYRSGVMHETEAESSESLGPKDGFNWPPKRVRSNRAVVKDHSPMNEPEPDQDLKRWYEGIARTAHACERAWLLPTSEPLAHRVRDTGFRALKAGAYCDRCGQPVGEGETVPEFGCGSCQGLRLPWDGLVTLGEYKHQLKDWVVEAKFAHNHRLAFDLGGMLGRSINAGQILDPKKSCAVVPMPTTRRRRLTLGIDHAG